MIAWAEAAPAGERAAAWVNPSARIPLDRAALAAIAASLGD